MQVRLENVSESPLGKSSLPPGHRPRSSTLSAAGGDSMRREFRATIQRAISNQANPLTAVRGPCPREGAVQGAQQSIAAGSTTPKATAITTVTVPGSVDINGSNTNDSAGRVNTAAVGGDDSSSVQGGKNLKSFTGSVSGISTQTPDIILSAKQQLPLMSNNNQQELDQGLVPGGRDGVIPVKMSREVEDEVFGGVKPLARRDDGSDKYDEMGGIPQQKISRPKMDM